MTRRTSEPEPDGWFKAGVVVGGVLTVLWWLVLVGFWFGIGYVAYHFLSKWW